MNRDHALSRNDNGIQPISWSLIALAGIFFLIPIQLLPMPMQMDSVDLWTLFVMVVFWSFFLIGRQRVIGMSLGYMVAVWLVLFASVGSVFEAVNPRAGLVVLLKEVYLVATWMTVATLLFQLNESNFRFAMRIWLATAVLHGLLIVAQFFSTDIYDAIASLGENTTDHKHYRPSGLFFSPAAGNANKAAMYQLMAFVPLFLAKPSRGIGLFSGLALLGSVLATGSMGTTLAFCCGLAASIAVIGIVGNRLLLMLRFSALAIVFAALMCGIIGIVISSTPAYQQHFQKILFGRVEKSSDGRFGLWQRGLETFRDSKTVVLGIGPENFRDIDVLEKQLHNEPLAFSVERGLLGLLGLALMFAVASWRAIKLLQHEFASDGDGGMYAVVFVGALAAVFMVSLTHQVFHAREIWLALAAQEAVIARHGVFAVARFHKLQDAPSSPCIGGAT
ncbi:MAG: O-antigen ligase family protein [Planctomycetota bacterium]